MREQTGVKRIIAVKPRADGLLDALDGPMAECSRSYLQACLLLLIAEKPDYGYDLGARINCFGFFEPDAAATYRALRALERRGEVISSWAPSTSGPARRIYSVTDAGYRALVAQGHEMRREQVRAERFLRRLAAIPIGRYGRPRYQSAEGGGVL